VSSVWAFVDNLRIKSDLGVSRFETVIICGSGEVVPQQTQCFSCFINNRVIATNCHEWPVLVNHPSVNRADFPMDLIASDKCFGVIMVTCLRTRPATLAAESDSLPVVSGVCSSGWLYHRFVHGLSLLVMGPIGWTCAFSFCCQSITRNFFNSKPRKNKAPALPKLANAERPVDR
jgi:hypothetical protein